MGVRRALDERPGEDKEIWFTGEFDTCPKNYDPESTAAVSDAGVTFEVFGVQRRHTLALGVTYGVHLDRACR